MSSKTKTVIIIAVLAVIIGSLIAVQVFVFGGSKKEKQAGQMAVLVEEPSLSEKIEEIDIRQPAVAGQFYPAEKNELGAVVDDYLSQAEKKNYERAPQMLIVPHAGYIYSGRVAAGGFKQLEGSGFKRAVVIGRSHQYSFSGVAGDGRKIWLTPLGEVKVDGDFIDLLKKTNSRVTVNSSVHNGEHSLEVMLPFLIITLGSDVKIVPLLFGDNNEEDILGFGETLAKLIDKNTVIIISSDLSHYPVYADAAGLDKKTIDAILTNDFFQFRKKIGEFEKLNIPQVATLACAEPAISTALVISKALGFQPHFLQYANSGDYFPELKNRVVGYGAIVFNNLKFDGLPEDILSTNDRSELNAEEQRTALEMARKTLEAAFRGEDYRIQVSGYRIFQEKLGAFVTLKKHGQLRGCIGNFEPDKSLAEVIKDMALAAAFSDRRFMPLASGELEEVDIEISVLSPREKIADHGVIEVGKHGVYVQKGLKSGVYLPQVATEQGWDKETFLNSLCGEKAGLERDCWKNGSADLYIFTAQIFGEK